MTFTSAGWNVTQLLIISAADDADRTQGTATIALDSVLGTTTLVATERDDDIPVYVDDDDDDEWYEPRNKCGVQPGGSSGLPFYTLVICLLSLCLVTRRRWRAHEVG